MGCGWGCESGEKGVEKSGEVGWGMLGYWVSGARGLGWGGGVGGVNYWIMRRRGGKG